MHLNLLMAYQFADKINKYINKDTIIKYNTWTKRNIAWYINRQYIIKYSI